MLTRPQLLVSSAHDLVARHNLSLHNEESRVGDGMPPADGEAWDTRFVCDVGTRSQMDRRTGRSAWPFPEAADPDELFQAALENGLLREEPEPGDIMTAWSPAQKRYVRSGLIVLVESTWTDDQERRHHECVTVEGNLNERGDARGPRVAFVRRVLSIERGDGFIRWADAIPQSEEAAA